MKTTDLERIKTEAKAFLYLDYEVADRLPPALFVHHPFLTSTMVYDPKAQEFMDIKDPKVLAKYRERMTKEIDSCDLRKLYILINKPYRLAFLKYTESFLSERDLAELLADAWVSSENPNQDANCSIPYLTKLFKRCDKRFLMSKHDYEVYERLPEQFPIYRGVCPGHTPKGLSWTRNKDKAIWFASRFNTEEEKGYLLTTVIHKSDVLAYFNTRGEEEILVNANATKYTKERIELE